MTTARKRPPLMDEAPHCAEAFSPITGRCFQVVSRQDGQAGWPDVTLSNENAPRRAWPSQGRRADRSMDQPSH